MKYVLKIVLLLFIPFIGLAQDSVIIITPENFSKDLDSYALASTDGWIFHQGNDSNWAKETIDVTDWKKLKPSKLSVKYADKNGRVEGWFRIKIRIDSSLGNREFGFRLGSFAATDLYINGQFLTTAGNTGNNGRLFKSNDPKEKITNPYHLKSGETYNIAIHVVDYTTTISPYLLKSEINNSLDNIISITGPQFVNLYLEYVQKVITIITISVSICAVLSLFFWILFFQNSSEKNLRIIAFCTTSIALKFYSSYQLRGIQGPNYVEFWATMGSFFGSLSFLLMLLLIVNIFKRKVTKALKVFSVVYFIFLFGCYLVPADISDPLYLRLTALLFIVFIYYVVTSWKNLKGAQWAVVAGLLVFLLLLIGLYILKDRFLSLCLAISFPLSLLVYVSIRFKEIITEVQHNANQVLQLSEEKKVQALNQQKILQDEVDKQTTELRTTLFNLKATQSQLIQSEKMASLGELTAGIAHEIQNPLNFVNNFSEVNKELITEMREEITKGNYDEVNVLAKDIEENEEKINHHGKRADAIVKGMLQHSRSSTSIKEPTDINKLADEYLRLAYHGLRAKDKSFNATMKTYFDETLEKVNVIPQDMGRVILNLITNAFYVVDEKKKSGIENYEPTVTVSTKKNNGKLEIKVSDNGSGIPQKVIDKIFQPFFTTKPSGKGTGLGLSLSYDIVKAHDGELKVNSVVNEKTEFVIILPI